MQGPRQAAVVSSVRSVELLELGRHKKASCAGTSSSGCIIKHTLFSTCSMLLIVVTSYLLDAFEQLESERKS